MIEKSKCGLQIDLNEFKLVLSLSKKTPLTFLFNSPSRKFYLSVIALVVNEMKRLGKIKSIPLQDHLDLLGLLNESVGGAVGSSDKENLLPRIYRKWKDALPNLEEAPLFKVIGRKKAEEDGGVGKIYSFSDAEKDVWANLFDYVGSDENVRLRFAIDKMGLSLEETSIIFEDFVNGDAWDRFISSLKKEEKKKDEPILEDEIVSPEPAAVSFSPPQNSKIPWMSRYRWVMIAVVIGVVAGVAITTIYLQSILVNRVSLESMLYPLPDKPSIVVLPFVNISEDPKQDFFSDGLTVEITNALSRLPQIFVIDRNSSFTYKGKAVNVKQVGRETGVQYVVEGSVRREGNRIRITAQLIDSTTGRHIFSERYDRELKDIFATQDDIAIKVLTALRIALTDGEWALLQSKGVSNVEAYFKLLEAREHHEKVNKESNERARRLAEEALLLDPGSSAAYATLAYAHFWDYWLGPPKSPEDSIQQGIALAQKSIELDNNPRAHGMLAMLYVNKGDYDLAVQEGELAASMDPGFLTPWGSTLTHASRHSEAIAVFQKALRVNPVKPPTMCLANLARSYQMIGKYEEAIRFYKKLLQDQPNHLPANSGLTATYSMMGRMEEAGAQAREVLRISPKFSLERWAKTLRFKNPEDVERYIDALRKAGLK